MLIILTIQIMSANDLGFTTVSGKVMVGGIEKEINIGGVRTDGGLDKVTYNAAKKRIFGPLYLKNEFIVKTETGSQRIFSIPPPHRQRTLLGYFRF